MQSKPFNNGFSDSNVKNSETNSNFGRNLEVVTGSRIADVLNNYVRNNHQVSSQVNRSANGHAIPAQGALDANMMKTINDRRDIKNILEMNPNAQLAIDICVNGTLSPNNTLDSQLQYKSTYDKLGGLKGEFLQKVKDFMNTYTELDDRLPTILRDAKYEVGSYALLVIPTGQIRDLINNEKMKHGDSSKNKALKLESVMNDLASLKYKKNKKASSYLKSQYLKFEDMGKELKKVNSEELISVHGDVEVLRLAKMKESLLDRSDVEECLESLESFSDYDVEADLGSVKQEGLNDAIILDSLKTSRSFSQDDVITLDATVDFEGTDVAAHMHIPHEAIYVMHKPGSPKEHKYYFIALDMAGNPVNVEPELNIYMPNYSGTFGNDASNSSMAGQANFAGGNLELGYNGYTDQSNFNRNLSDKAALFSRLMEDQLVKAISDGDFKNSDISLAEHADLMNTMFNRYLSNKQTQLLLVPASLMTYFAFEYDDNGNGVSLIIKHKTIGVLNSILTLANTLCAINNTIDYKEVKVKFDDDELDFAKTTDMIVGNLVRNTSMNGSRLINTDINKQFDYLGHKGYQLAFEDHPQHPGTSVEINNLDRERTAPDPDVIEKNESLLIQGLGSTPEVVDMARNVEYASSYFQSNLQAARRAIADQKILTRDVDKFVRIFSMNSPALLKWMIKEVDKSRKDNPELKGIKTIVVVKEFINSITTHLPKPDMVKVELLDKAITAQETLTDHILKYTIGEEALRPEDVGDDLTGALEALRTKVKAMIMRDFMASNNMLGDGFIGALYSGDREEVDSIMSRLETTQEFILDVLKEHDVMSNLIIKKANTEVAKINEAQELGSNGGGGSSDFGNTETNTETTDSNTDTDPNANPDGGDPNASEDPNDPFAG